jgi:MinD superfamily P-loop ATPase
MIVAVASGKGGTGKTTVATGLALAMASRGRRVQFLDCDVEEPNAAILLKPRIESSRRVASMVPKIDAARCTLCGRCSDFCRFNALVTFPDRVDVFPELCHACRGCVLACPEGAVSDGEVEIGTIEEGTAGDIRFAHALLDIGQARATPLLGALRARIDAERDVVLDAPPGTSCPFVETVRMADACILVTEPTPFGLYDLGLAVDALRSMGIAFSVAINRCDLGDDRVERFCRDEGIEVVLRIPNDIEIAKAYSVGRPITELDEMYSKMIYGMFERIGGRGAGR